MNIDMASSPDYPGAYQHNGQHRYAQFQNRGASIPTRGRETPTTRDQSYQRLDSASQFGISHTYNQQQSPYQDRTPMKGAESDHPPMRASSVMGQSGNGYMRSMVGNSELYGNSRAQLSVSPPPNMQNPLSDIGSSKSYIMAMKTLQVKLEEKDRRIRELEDMVNHIQDQQENNPHLGNNGGPRHTATFGAPELSQSGFFGVGSGQGTHRQQQLGCSTSNTKGGQGPKVPGLSLHTQGNKQSGPPHQPRIEMVALDGRSGQFQGNRGAMMSVEAEDSQRGLGVNQHGGQASYLNLSTSCSRCVETDQKTSRIEELQRELELTKKKLAMQKEQNGLIQENLESSNTQLGMLESQLIKKDKELKSLQCALQNMKELVDIISKKKKEHSILSTSSLHESQTHHSPQDYHQRSTSSVSLGKQTNETASGSTSEFRSKRSRSAFEEIFVDIVTYVTLNPELSYEEIDLFYHMRAKLLEQEDAFKTIRDNMDFMKQTKSVLLDKAHHEGRPGASKFSQDVRTIESLISFSKALLSLQEGHN